jgi:hypothetical protein
LYDVPSRTHRWLTPRAGAATRPWRSIRIPLGFGAAGGAGAGIDLTRAEHIEFWTAIDTSVVRRSRNPVLVFDFGDISENSLVFAPETLSVSGTRDSTFSGRRLAGFDRLDTERDRPRCRPQSDERESQRRTPAPLHRRPVQPKRDHAHWTLWGCRR